jgi:hypothetical protein
MLFTATQEWVVLAMVCALELRAALVAHLRLIHCLAPTHRRSPYTPIAAKDSYLDA